MRSQSYGDKQRDEQRRKKQEDLWKKANPEATPPSDTTGSADTSNQPPVKSDKKNTSPRRSA